MLWGLQAGARHADDTLVVTMHLHLAPLALPLVSRGAKLAVFLHGIEAWTPLSGIRLAAMQQADFLVVNSRFTAERFRSSNPQCAAKEIRVCPLGVPQREFSSTPRAEGRPFALIVARLAAEERYKGHDLLLEIWRDVMALIPGARLVVVGDGNDRQRLETKARQLALADAVAFLGRVTDGELDRLYRDCRFLVMPSSEEGFGLAFVEAMRAGKPCIAAKGAAEEVVVDGETGLVVAPNDRDALWSAVTRLFADPALCERMGHAGRDRFVAQFTEAQFRGRFLTALGLRPDGGVS
jgi:phosphatidylinositol alpha-1,6-mannosyltransferase